MMEPENMDDPNLKKIHDLMSCYPKYKSFILSEINNKSEYMTYKDLYFYIDEYILEHEYEIHY